MSSWKNAAKSQAKSHRERSQPTARAHLGLLEKKKDYKLRAEDYQKKRDTLRGLKRKALDRNPDEYYFNMVHTQKMDGVHQRKESDELEHTDAQLKLMYSQDQRYVNMKRASELKKIEKLKSSLHLIDSDEKPKNKHVIFVDTKKEAAKFDPAAYFDTHPALVDRVYNRPRRKTLERGHLVGLQDEEELKELAKKREKQYKQLAKRIEREKELNIISQKMEMKKHLLDKKAKRKKIQDETKSAPAQYRWCYQRKR